MEGFGQPGSETWGGSFEITRSLLVTRFKERIVIDGIATPSANNKICLEFKITSGHLLSTQKAPVNLDLIQLRARECAHPQF